MSKGAGQTRSGKANETRNKRPGQDKMNTHGDAAGRWQIIAARLTGRLATDLQRDARLNGCGALFKNPSMSALRDVRRNRSEQLRPHASLSSVSFCRYLRQRRSRISEALAGSIWSGLFLL